MTTIPLTEKVTKDLKRINREVNRLPYKTDLKLYETEEFWTRITERGGDCEDYVLEKRFRLMDLGYPAEALRVTICKIPEGYHAVLTVDTDQGTYVLDNNHDRIYTWTQPPYHWIEWIARQGPQLGSWVKLGNCHG